MPVPMRGGAFGPWRPWSFRQVFDEFDRLFERMQQGFFGPLPFEEAESRGRGIGMDWAPVLDVQDIGREFVLTAELPGFEPNEVQVESTGDTLTIRGEHREEEEGHYQGHRSFFRQISVPVGADLEKANASFRNGLLRIRLPKAQENVKNIPISSEPEPPQQRAA